MINLELTLDRKWLTEWKIRTEGTNYGITAIVHRGGLILVTCLVEVGGPESSKRKELCSIEFVNG